jgi:hypothetical protein
MEYNNKSLFILDCIEGKRGKREDKGHKTRVVNKRGIPELE